MRVRRSRLTDEQTARLLEHFVAGTPARVAAELAHVNRNTARLFYHRMRELIAQRLSNESPLPANPARDEDRSAGTPSPGGQAQRVEAPVFALVRRGEKILTVMMPEPGARAVERSALPLPPDSIVYSGTTSGTLEPAGSAHEPVARRARLAHGRSPMSGSENFLSQAKRQLRRYNGVPRQHFYLFLKECEWRYNYGPPKELLKLLKSWLRSSTRGR